MQLARLQRLRDYIFANRVFEGVPCSYCGSLASDSEHVIPRSHLRHLAENGQEVQEITTPSCKECNQLCYSRVFKDFYEKKRYVRARIRRKYRCLLRMPIWTDSEIQELDGHLRTYLEECLRLRVLTLDRLRWNVPPVLTVRQFILDVAPGNASAQNDAGIRGTSPESERQ